jgi:hypothetical protein
MPRNIAVSSLKSSIHQFVKHIRSCSLPRFAAYAIVVFVSIAMICTVCLRHKKEPFYMQRAHHPLRGPARGLVVEPFADDGPFKKDRECNMYLLNGGVCASEAASGRSSSGTCTHYSYKKPIVFDDKLKLRKEKDLVIDGKNFKEVLSTLENQMKSQIDQAEVIFTTQATKVQTALTDSNSAIRDANAAAKNATAAVKNANKARDTATFTTVDAKCKQVNSDYSTVNAVKTPCVAGGCDSALHGSGFLDMCNAGNSAYTCCAKDKKKPVTDKYSANTAIKCGEFANVKRTPGTRFDSGSVFRWVGHNELMHYPDEPTAMKMGGFTDATEWANSIITIPNCKAIGLAFSASDLPSLKSS